MYCKYLTLSLQIELSWYGEDPESGIYDYEVGLSSTGSDVTDVMPYQSTHGHRHFVSYHPGLGDGATVYFHIKAVSRAGAETIKVGELYFIAHLHVVNVLQILGRCVEWFII